MPDAPTRSVEHWTRAALLAAAVPALVGSALIMRAIDVDRVDIAQQLAVMLLAATAAMLVPTAKRHGSDERSPAWPALVLAACLFLPLTDSQEWGPRRWLYFGGFGLYVAPVVIPALLLGAGGRPAAALLLGGLALTVQPDAAQLTALAVASSPLLFTSRHGWVMPLFTAAAFLVAVLVCWRIPDPLAPVDHVEGVLRIAASMGPLVLGGALLAALLPSMTLLRLAVQHRSASLLSAGLYFATLVCLAPLEVTPVPLLGFGSGPILGYALMVWVVAPLAFRR